LVARCPPSEQFCSDRRHQQVQTPRGGVVTEGGKVRVRSVPAICRRGPALGRAIQDRRREEAPVRAGAHVDPAAIASDALVTAIQGPHQGDVRHPGVEVTFDTVDSAIAHADQLAAKLGLNRSTHEVRGRSVRVRHSSTWLRYSETSESERGYPKRRYCTPSLGLVFPLFS
jgi:hypothetical protein